MLTTYEKRYRLIQNVRPFICDIKLGETRLRWLPEILSAAEAPLKTALKMLQRYKDRKTRNHPVRPEKEA